MVSCFLGSKSVEDLQKEANNGDLSRSESSGALTARTGDGSNRFEPAPGDGNGD